MNNRPPEDAPGWPHALGEAMGVIVHGPPVMMDIVEETLIQENMAFTVEPSIIYPGKYGNRVEDVVVVTPDGGRVLNRASHELVVID
jgi:Xaa-Pro aminopeptidase